MPNEFWEDKDWAFDNYYDRKRKAAYWDGQSDTGESVSSGVYFYHLQVSEAIPHSGTGDFFAVKKMIIKR